MYLVRPSSSEVAMDNRKVVLDADFFRKFTDNESNTKVLETLLSDLGYSPVMHHYVATRELRNNKMLEDLKNQGKIKIIRDSDFIPDNELEDYDSYFRNAYRKVNAFDLDEEVNVLEYGYTEDVYHESLGEIRSIYLARKLKYDVFLSNDNGSKQIVDYVNSKKHHIDVYNVAEILFRCKKEGTSLAFKDLKNVLYQLQKDKCKQIEELYNIFHK